MILSIGSRDSLLARQQAEPLVEELDESEGVRADLVTRSSAGDEDQDRALDNYDQTGVFTSNLNEAVLDGSIDAAVHSLKDLPTERPEDLTLAAVPPRTTPFDMLVGRADPDLSDEDGLVIGTSSRRRRGNLLFLNSDLNVEGCRGNVPTRLDKLYDEEQYDALVLAAAGLERLGMEEITNRLFRLDEMLPAAGQGALAVVAHAENEPVLRELQTLDHRPSRRTTRAERALLHRLEAGCQAPVGTVARVQGNQMVLRAHVTHPEGERRLEVMQEGLADEPRDLGMDLAEDLLERGAAELIHEVAGEDSDG